MAVVTMKPVSAAPAKHQEARIRTAREMWQKIRDLNEHDADRMKIAAAYWQLEDLLILVPERYRLALSGSLASEGAQRD